MFLRLHLILVEARAFPAPVFPGDQFMGLSCYALDNQRQPIFEVHPEPGQSGWHLAHVKRELDPPLQYRTPNQYHVIWPLHRGYFHDAWALHPQFGTEEICKNSRPASSGPLMTISRSPYRSCTGSPVVVDVSSTDISDSTSGRCQVSRSRSTSSQRSPFRDSSHSDTLASNVSDRSTLSHTNCQ